MTIETPDDLERYLLNQDVAYLNNIEVATLVSQLTPLLGLSGNDDWYPAETPVETVEETYPAATRWLRTETSKLRNEHNSGYHSTNPNWIHRQGPCKLTVCPPPFVPRKGRDKDLVAMMDEIRTFRAAAQK